MNEDLAAVAARKHELLDQRRDDDFVADDGSYQKTWGILFDRVNSWVCRSCGSVVEHTANHAAMHLEIDAVTGRER